jgi:ribose 5-phosphate isomerase B
VGQEKKPKKRHKTKLAPHLLENKPALYYNPTRTSPKDGIRRLQIQQKGKKMIPKNTLYLGSDHGGYILKTQLKNILANENELHDLGCYSEDRVDYPDIASSVAKAVLSTPGSIGILVCGTGIGISIKANRYPGIRAAIVYNDFTAEMAKAHNNANILCLGGRTTLTEDALRYIAIWQKTAYEGGRHDTRLRKLDTPL